VEAAAECDEHLFEKYIEGKAITPEEIMAVCGGARSHRRFSR